MTPAPPAPVQPDTTSEQPRRSGRWRSLTADTILWSLAFIPIIGGAGWLGFESTQPADCLALHDIRAAAHWFDPVFFQYNLILGSVAILIVPTVPLFYAKAMAWRKNARLLNELSAADWQRVNPHLERRGESRFYWASAMLTMMIVTLGVVILLLFKPGAAPGCGVDFSKGANMLMLGPFIGIGPPADADAAKLWYGHLVHGLTGFQFGFLGAYIYFLTALSRAFFMLDLTPETFIEGALRIAIASVLALIFSFSLDPSGSILGLSTPEALLPTVSFFFGFFPKRALAFLENMVGTWAHAWLPGGDNKVMPLCVLHGMSYDHEIRLEREGFDSIENFSHADAAGLAVRTGFSYGQLRQWISEAALLAMLREDYAKFVSLTGLSSLEELRRFLSAAPDPETGLTQLIGAGSDQQISALRHKVGVIGQML